MSSTFNYCSLVWHFCGKKSTRKVEYIQERCLRFIYGDFISTYASLLFQTKAESLYMQRCKKMLKFTFKVLQKEVPQFMYDMFKFHETQYNLRDNVKLELPKYNSVNYGKLCIRYEGAKLFSNLPVHMKMSDSSQDFNNVLSQWQGPHCHCGECFMCLSRLTSA